MQSLGFCVFLVFFFVITERQDIIILIKLQMTQDGQPLST